MRPVRAWQSDHGPSWEVNFRDIDEQLIFLRGMVAQFRFHPQVRDLALKIIREDDSVQPRDKKAQAIAIGQWTQDNIYYVHELPERFQTPIETLREKAGDCDDGTVLICSLLEAIGIPSNLVCMKLCPQATSSDFMCNWKHIFPAAVMVPKGSLLPLDWTMKGYRVREVANPVEWALDRGRKVTLKIA